MSQQMKPGRLCIGFLIVVCVYVCKEMQRENFRDAAKYFGPCTQVLFCHACTQSKVRFQHVIYLEY